MDFKESAKIVELENEVKQLKADITHLQQENKEIWRILNTLINQNAVELSEIHTQKDKNNAPNTQHGLSAGFTGQTPNGASELAELRFNAFNSQQNSFSHRQDNGRHTPLRSLLASIDSTGQENGQSHSSDRERNRVESRSETQSRESGALSQANKDIEALYRKSLKCTELERAEFNRLLLDFLKFNKEIEPNLEKKLNDNISKIIKEHKAKKPYVYAAQLESFTQETMKRIKKEVFFLNAYGYDISQDNAKAIQNLLLTQRQDRTVS